ncbi:phage head morphogenesis protein, partial [Bordetella avium]
DNPPIIDKTTGERGLPGQLINCKCRMRPVIDFSGYLNE